MAEPEREPILTKRGQKIAGHGARAGAALARSTSATVQGAHAALPVLPQPTEQWGGYWTFVTATIVVMFILYTAQKGTLSTWLSFFAWSNPSTPTVGGATTSLTSGLATSASQFLTLPSQIGGAANATTGAGGSGGN